MLSLFLGLSRADEAPASYGASASQEVHLVAGCDIGYAYDIWNMDCGKAPAFYKPADCTDDDPSNTNCIASRSTGEWTYYDDKTTTTTQTESLMSMAMTAEGSGWGTSVSASADYMQKNSLTSNSVTYWIGQAGEAYSEYLQNVGAMELSGAASTQLANNWETFVAMYGTHYVSELIYTTRFIGSLQISSTSESSASDLSVAMSLSYKGLCEASGTAKFDQATSGTSGSLTSKLSAQWVGGAQKWDVSADGVTQLNNTFNKWQDANLANPKGNSEVTKMVYRSLFDLEQVQQIVIANYNDTTINDIQKAFYLAVPTSTTMETITTDYLMAKTQKNSLKLYQTYECQEKLKLTDTIQSYINSLTSHISLLEHMDDKDLIQRQTDIDGNDYTWFIGRSLAYTNEIEDKLAGCVPPTQAPTQDLGCMNLAYNGRCGPDHEKQLCSTWFNSAYRYCNYNNGYCEKSTDNRATGQSKFYDEDNIRDNCNPYIRASVVDSTCKQLDSAFPWRGADAQQHGWHPVCFNSKSRARKRTYTCGYWCCIPGSEWRCKNFGCPNWTTCGESTLADRLEAKWKVDNDADSNISQSSSKWKVENDADSNISTSPSKTLRNLVERNFVSNQK